MVKITCEQCDVIFAARPSENRKFCSAECYRSYETTHGRPNPVQKTAFKCKICDTEFFRRPGDIAQYRKQFGVDPRYCSIPCSAEGRKRDSERDVKITCVQCGIDMPVVRRKDGTLDKRQTRRFCGTPCRQLAKRLNYQARHPDQQITKTPGRHGYIRLVIPGKNGEPSRKDVLEHRYVMEQEIGRPLRSHETVHHKNGQRGDNRAENLELFSSRHGPGHRIVDQIEHAIETLRLYPEFLSDTDRSELASLLDHAAKVSRT